MEGGGIRRRPRPLPPPRRSGKVRPGERVREDIHEEEGFQAARWQRRRPPRLRPGVERMPTALEEKVPRTNQGKKEQPVAKRPVLLLLLLL